MSAHPPVPPTPSGGAWCAQVPPTLSAPEFPPKLLLVVCRFVCLVCFVCLFVACVFHVDVRVAMLESSVLAPSSPNHNRIDSTSAEMSAVAHVFVQPGGSCGC